MKPIFFNERGQIRSGWRVAVFILAFTFAAVLLGTIGQMAMAALGIDPERGSRAYFAANAVLSLIPAILVGWVCGKFLEQLPFRVLGAAFTDGWFKHLIFGLVVGAATLGFAVLIAYISGGLRFEVNDGGGFGAIVISIAMSFLVFAAAAAFEEALFRGYILQTLSRSGLAWLAILLTSLFFGAVHMRNPDTGIFSTVNTILAGVWFSVAWLKTRDLWFVWGIHLMWNWTQGSIFGIEVSGITSITVAPLLREIDSGPTWLTGQSYGLEGGIACTITLIASIVVIHFLPNVKPDRELLAMSGSFIK